MFWCLMDRIVITHRCCCRAECTEPRIELLMLCSPWGAGGAQQLGGDTKSAQRYPNPYISPIPPGEVSKQLRGAYLPVGLNHHIITGKISFGFLIIGKEFQEANAVAQLCSTLLPLRSSGIISNCHEQPHLWSSHVYTGGKDQFLWNHKCR